jgi:GT2 family glycosyltransferase
MTDEAVGPDLSIVLVNWNALELTRSALISIHQHTSGLRYEALVVDNSVPLETSGVGLAEQFPWVTVITNGQNYGFTRASNQGIRRARGRYILLLNTDTVQTENALAKAVQYADSHPEIGALGIEHRNADPELTPQRSTYPFPSPWMEVRAMLVPGASWRGQSEAYTDASEQDVDWACGSFLLLRRECLEEVGLLDERFFTYAEDIDWCRRAVQAGWKIRFWRGARMIHLGAASQPFIRDKTFMHLRSQLEYYRKHHGRVMAAMYYLAVCIRLCIATSRQVVLWFAGRSNTAAVRERWRRQLQFASRTPNQMGV